MLKIGYFNLFLLIIYTFILYLIKIKTKSSYKLMFEEGFIIFIQWYFFMDLLAIFSCKFMTFSKISHFIFFENYQIALVFIIRSFLNHVKLEQLVKK